VNRREWRWVLLVTLSLLITSSRHCFIAWVGLPEGVHLAAFIFNPQDGNSHVASDVPGARGPPGCSI
jgi:hypothetical protein